MFQLEFFALIGSIIGAFAIGFIIWWFRDIFFGSRIEKTHVEEIIEKNLSRIREYAREQNYKSATILIYQTFAIGAEYYLKTKRHVGETARELAMKVLGKEDIDSRSVNTIIRIFESARYSNQNVSVQEFNDALRGLHRFLQIATEKPIDDEIASDIASGREIETTAR